MDRGAWRATVHGVAQSQTRLKKRLSNTAQEMHELTLHFLKKLKCYKQDLSPPHHAPHSPDVHSLAHLFADPSLCSYMSIHGQWAAQDLGCLCDSEVHTVLSTTRLFITHLMAEPALNYQ